MNIATASNRRPPNVEHLAPLSFNDAVTAWADQRFEPNGVGDTVIEVTVDHATITERALDVDGGIRGMLKKEQAVEYEARLSVSVRAVGPSGQQRSATSAEVWRTQTVGEDATMADKQKVLFDMIEASVRAMDAKLIPDFRRYFANYVL